MNHWKTILLVGLLAISGCALAIFFVVISNSTNKGKLLGNNQIPPFYYGTSTAVAISPAAQSNNAFVSGGNNDVVLPGGLDNKTPLSSSSADVLPAGISGAGVTSLSDVQNIVSSALSAEKQTVTLLALPDVQNSEIVVSSSGASTALDYLTYFSAHSKSVIFDGKKLNNVLKDKNGAILFIPNLIEEAITDDNFTEVASSLSVQKEFTESEINFLKSIPVSGTAIAINKENIGLEELMVGVVDKALAVSAGSLAKNDFINYYDQFDVTAENTRRSFVAQSGILSMGKQKNIGIVGNILRLLGLETPAAAQSAGNPFGGKVSLITPCICDVGELVTVGPPNPAEIFVPIAFLATPLFFLIKQIIQERGGLASILLLR